MASGGCDEDTETDAQPYFEGFNPKEGIELPFDDEEYLNYIDLMPPELKNDNSDILILHDESDRSAVNKFSRRIQRDCFVTVGNARRHPVVKTEQDFGDASSMSLDNAFCKTLYIFLYVTQSFCKCDINLHQGYSCLVKALEEKRWCVIPVYIEDKDTRKKKGYKLPMMLNSLKPINYWDTNFYKEAVSKLLDSKVSDLAQMEIDLQKQRVMYFVKHKKELREQYKVILKSKNLVRSFSKPLIAKSSRLPIQEEAGGYETRPKEFNKSHSESELIMQHASFGQLDPMANPQLSGSQSAASEILHSPSSLQVDTRERAQNLPLPQSNLNANLSVARGNHGPSQEQSYMCADSSTVQLNSPLTFQSESQHCGSAISNEGSFNFQNMAYGLSQNLQESNNNLSREMKLQDCSLDDQNHSFGSCVPQMSSTLAEPPMSSNLESSSPGLHLQEMSDEVEANDQSMKDSFPGQRLSNLKACAEPSHEGEENDSKHQNPMGQPEPVQTEKTESKDSDNSRTSSTGTGLTVHHHHHYHHHIEIKKVKYMTVGESSKILAHEYVGDSNDDAEGGNDSEEEHYAKDQRDSDSDETDLKSPATKTEDDEEQTHVKTVDESLSSETRPKDLLG
ncbi:hypothetical protein PoB_001708100 [Plakobranchus ocellatus]|uniref:TIR domain-containing protein n=1 Tax=Plakobranchus ocellatus TaxID=259542 RepID=A0AAV3YU08_9GAST|nr:hypothetical protein PoB_001708100 [Plakobranchus ocellatus]